MFTRFQLSWMFHVIAQKLYTDKLKTESIIGFTFESTSRINPIAFEESKIIAQCSID